MGCDRKQMQSSALGLTLSKETASPVRRWWRYQQAMTRPQDPNTLSMAWHEANIYLAIFDRVIIEVSHKQQKNTDCKEKACDKKEFSSSNETADKKK